MIIKDKLYDTSMIKMLIFDVDNTITRWKNVKLFLKKALDNLEIPYSDAALFGLFSAMKERELHSVITGESGYDVYSSLLDFFIPDLKAYGKSGNDLREIMFELEPSETYVSEETVEEIKILSEKYILICYTDWFWRQTYKKLERYGLESFFRAIHSSEDLYVKYSKIGFVYLAKKYNLSPKEIVHIGDSRNDIYPSSAAGLNSIYLNYQLDSEGITDEQRKLVDRASATVTQFGDIRKVLTK